MSVKVCSVCLICKDIAEMVPYRAKCKVCYRVDQKRRYNVNKEKLRQKRLDKLALGDKYVKSAKKVRFENETKVLKAEVERLTNLLNNLVSLDESKKVPSQTPA